MSLDFFFCSFLETGSNNNKGTVLLSAGGINHRLKMDLISGQERDITEQGCLQFFCLFSYYFLLGLYRKLD